jgi:hypothetical protein
MRTTSLAVVCALLAVAGCYGGDDDDGDGTGDAGGGNLADEQTPISACPAPGQPGGPSGGCEVMVADQTDCPRLDDVCRPEICGSFDCCFCDGNSNWNTLFIDCFEGCGGFTDAPESPVDGPPPDGCGAFDAGVAPHC